MTRSDQIMPVNVEAEEAVIGSVLLELGTDELDRIISIVNLQPEDFWVIKYQWIWRAILDLRLDRMDIDPLTVSDRLGGEALDKIGGPAELLRLQGIVYETFTAVSYAKIVKDRSFRRKQIDILGRKAETLYHETLTIPEIMKEWAVIEQDTPAIMTSKMTTAEQWDRYDRILAERDSQKDTLVRTGMREIDELGVINFGEYTIIQGLANIGKSFLAQTIVCGIAAHTNTPIIYYTFENSAEEVMDRLVSITSGIPYDALRPGKTHLLPPAERLKAIETAMSFKGKIEIVEELSGMDEVLADIESKMVTLFDYRKPLVVIDNMNNIADKMQMSEYQAINYISAQALDYTRTRKIAWVMLAQMRNDYKQGLKFSSEAERNEYTKQVLTPTMRSLEGSRKPMQHAHNALGIQSANYVRRKMGVDDFVIEGLTPEQILVNVIRKRNGSGEIEAVLNWNSYVPRYESKYK